MSVYPLLSWGAVVVNLAFAAYYVYFIKVESPRRQRAFMEVYAKRLAAAAPSDRQVMLPCIACGYVGLVVSVAENRLAIHAYCPGGHVTVIGWSQTTEPSILGEARAIVNQEGR